MPTNSPGYDAAYWAANHDAIVAKRHERFASNPDYAKLLFRKDAKAYRDRLKMDVMSHYCNGVPHCQCVGGCDIEAIGFLTIDHIENGGKLHRKDVGWGWKFYLWLKRNGYPPGFRVLCFNCNSGRQINGGICPHQGAISSDGQSRSL
jgi:hypothetical protein